MDKAETVFEKLAIVPGWGGMTSTIGTKDSPINAQVGYGYALGLIPFPRIGVRIGKRKGTGVSIGTMLSVDSGVAESSKFTGSIPRSVWKYVTDEIKGKK